MISKLIVIDVSAGEHLVQTLNVLKAQEVHVLKYDFSKGFVNAETGKLTFVEEIKSFVREYAQVDTVKLTDVCVVNPQQKPSNTPSPMYNNSPYVLDNDGENTASELAKWDYLASTMKHLNLGALVQHLDFIDVNHLLQDKPYQITLDYVNSRVKETVQEEGVGVNWLSHDMDVAVGSDELLNSTNWLHAMCTTFYSGVVKTIVDKYFKLNTTVLEVISSIPLEVDIVEEDIVDEDDGDIKYLLNENVGQSDELITNIILYDLDLKQSVEEVRNALLPNTMIVTFGPENTYEELQNVLKELHDTDGFEIENVALFQRNYSNLSEYTFLTEEHSIIESVESSDPDLYTWQKFIDFVVFLGSEIDVHYFDLMMCNIYSDENWKYVINYISNETPIGYLEIRSSEDVTGHSALDGDWVLESPEVDVNMIGLYFSQSIEDVKIKLDNDLPVVSIPFDVNTSVYQVKTEEPTRSYHTIYGYLDDTMQTRGYYAKGNVYFDNTLNRGAGISAGTQMSSDIFLFNENDFTVDFFVYPTQNPTNSYTAMLNLGNKNNATGTEKYVFEVNYLWGSYGGNHKKYISFSIGHGALGTGQVWNTNNTGSGPTGTRAVEADHVIVNELNDEPLIEPNTLNNGRYHHICLSRKGNTFTAFLDGIIRYQETKEWDPKVEYSIPHDMDGGLRIGAESANSSLYYKSFYGNIQDLKIINGIGRDQPFSIVDAYAPSTKAELQTAVDAWCADPVVAQSSYGHISTWNTESITDMQSLFHSKSNFDDDIRDWNVSNVTAFNNMFEGASSFNQNLSKWQIQSGANLSQMFLNATSFSISLFGAWIGNLGLQTGMFDGTNGAQISNYFTPTTKAELTTAVNSWCANPAEAFYEYGYISSWNTVNITDMSSLFWSKQLFNSDISGWNVSNVTDMNGMFYAARMFNQNINSWDTSNVRDTNHMFYNAQQFNQPLNSWNVSNVTNISKMFFSAISFNHPIDDWNVSSVTSMSRTFYNAHQFNQPLNSWNVSNVIYMPYLFYSARKFNQPLSGWNTATQNVIDMDHMFYDARLFNQNINSWDVSKVKNMGNMFALAFVYNQPMNNWDVSNVTSFRYMFYRSTAFDQNISDWNIQTTANLEHMFRGARSFSQALGGTWGNNIGNQTEMLDDTNGAYIAISFSSGVLPAGFNDSTPRPPLSLGDLKKAVAAWNTDQQPDIISAIGTPSLWNVSEITNMDQLFYNKSQFNEPIDGWDVSKVTSMHRMFQFAHAFNQPLNSWDVSRVTDMLAMFGRTYVFNQPLNNWTVSNVTTMHVMFYRADVFNQPLNNWDVSNVNNMEIMFQYAYVFNQPLNDWDVSNVNNMKAMFHGASQFNGNINSWQINPTANLYRMFYTATSFSQTLTGVSWINHTGDQSQMFDGTNGASISSTLPTPPTLTLSNTNGVDSGTTSTSGKLNMSLTVSTDDYRFRETDFKVTNGAISNFNRISNASYTFDFASSGVGLSSSVYIVENTVFNYGFYATLNEAVTFDYTWNYSPTAPDISLSSQDVSLNDNNEFISEKSEITMDLEILENGTASAENEITSSTFTASDISCVNGTVVRNSIVAVSSTRFTFKVQANSDSSGIEVFMPSGKLTRVINNISEVLSNEPSDIFIWNYELKPLTVISLSAAQHETGITVDRYDVNNGNNKKTNISELWVKVEFSENVFGFDKSFISTTNCRISRIVGSNTTYSVKVRTLVPNILASIEIISDPNKEISIRKGIKRHIESGDLSFEWQYDDTRPEVTITSSQSSGVTNNLSYIDLSFALSHVATDFDISSVTLTGDAVLSDFAGSGQDYSVRVTPTPGVSTAISVLVDDNAFTNSAGSGNSASSSFVWNYDGVAPTIEITSPDVTSGSSSEPFVDVFFTPSKNIIDFLTLNNAVVTNGTLFSLTKVEPYADNQTTFVVTVSAKTSSHPYEGQGSSSGYFIDGVESPELTFIVGQTYTFDQSDATNSGHPIVFYDNKYKNGSQYTANVTVNGTAGTSGSTVSITIDENTPNPLYYHCGAHAYMGYRMNRSETYYGKIQPKASGDVTIVIPSVSVVDVAGNSNVVSNTFTFNSTLATDIIVPTLSSSEVTNGGISQNEIVEIVVDASGNVNDLTISDISCTNGTISAIEGLTFDVTSNLKGVPTTLFILEDTLSTTASNIQSNVFTWTYSPLVPILTMTSSQVNEGEDTSANQIDLSLTFVNPPSLFAIGDLTITNGTGTLTGTGSSYSLSVVVDDNYNGLVSVTLPKEQVYYNSIPNYNDVSYNFEWYYDTTPPVLTFPDTMPSNIASRRIQRDTSTNIRKLTLTIESTEYITGVNLSNFTATNALLSNLSSKEGTTFTFDIEPIDNKVDCSIDVLFEDPLSLVKDRAGNPANVGASNNFAYSYIYVSKKKNPDTLAAELGVDNDTIAEFLSIATSFPSKGNPFSSSEEEQVVSISLTNISFVNNDDGRKNFSDLMDQLFVMDEEEGEGETTEIKIDKSSIPLVSTAAEKLAVVEEVKVIKSNQEEPIVIETSTTEPTATYIPLANVGDFAIVTINDVEYTTNVIGDASFELSSDVSGVIGTFTSGEVYSHDAENSIIFGSQIISNNPVIPDQPPTLTFTSSQVTSGGTSSSQSVELTITFSTTVDIQIGDVDPLNSDTNVTATSNYGDITVTVTPVDASTNSTLGVFIGANTFYDASGTYNDVSYTFSWNYSLTGSGGGGSGDIPCFLKGTQILTTKGYKNVEVLDPHKDKLLDKDNNVLELLELKSYKQENNGVHYPHKIPGGTQLSEKFTCTKDLYMTYNHCIYIPDKNKYVPVSMMKRLKPEKSLPQSVFEYYHVFTANYFSDTIMANGIPCETTGKYMFKKLFSIDRNGDLFRKVLDIVNMKPNCMRDRITNKEMRNIIKKFSKSGAKMLTK